MKHVKIQAVLALALLSATSVSFAATGITVTATGTTVGDMTVTTTQTAAASTGASLEVTNAPRLIKKTDSSVTLEWDKVATASAYIVKYSKTSVANSEDPNAQYDNESDQVTATGVTIDKLSSTNEKLAPNTVYYFSVVAVDKDGKESDTFSDELAVTTDAAGAATATGATTATGAVSGLAVSDVTVVNNTTLSVAFNAELSADALKAKVVKTSDNSDVAIQNIVKDATNPKVATITLAAALAPTSSYTLTIISAKDTQGNNIQEGVSGLKEFTTPETMAVGSAVTDASGATLSGSLNPADSTKVATGAKENLLIVAALMLSFGIVYIYRRKLI